MKKCPYCAEDIQDAAIVCKHCGRNLATRQTVTAAAPPVTPKKAGRLGRIILFAVLGTIGLAALLIFAGPEPSSPTDAINGAAAKDLVDRAVAGGFITRWTCSGNEASVTPVFWNSLDAQGKRGVVLSLGKLCAMQQSGDRMTVYDSHSGKRVAEYSGLSVTFD